MNTQTETTVRINAEMVDGEVKIISTIKPDSSATEKLLFLAKQKEALVEQLKELNKELEVVLLEVGVDKYIQDPETLLVYKVVKPKGTFVSFKEVDYVRTKKESEERGDLSVKEAKAAGFVLTKETST